MDVYLMKTVMVILNFSCISILYLRKAVRWHLIMTSYILESLLMSSVTVIDALNIGVCPFYHFHFPPNHLLHFCSIFLFSTSSLFLSQLSFFAPYPHAYMPKSFPSIFGSFCLRPPCCRLCGADTVLQKSHTTERERKIAQMVNQWGVS